MIGILPSSLTMKNSKPLADISDKKQEIKELEAKKKLDDAENEKRMAEMQKSLDQMSGYEKEEK